MWPMSSAFAAALANIFVAVAIAAAADMPGDAESGRRIARETCSVCHSTGDAPARLASDAVPTFVSLANDPIVTPIYVRAFLQTPHARMPNLMLTNREIDDIISYLQTLKRK